MDDLEEVNLAIESYVATITLNKPHIKNAFDDSTITTLNKILDSINVDPRVRVVIIKGAGSDFCAGGDLNWMKRMINYTEDENFQDALNLAKLMRKLNNLSKATIACIQGAAYGGGVGFVSCCDIAIASNDASFCLSEAKIGLIPAVICPYVLTAIGETNIRRFALTAEIIDAKTAKEINLVHEVVPKNKLESTVNNLASQIISNAPNAISQAKKLIHSLNHTAKDAHVDDLTSRLIAKLRVSKEGQEGMNAFLEKRKPNW